MNSEFDAIRAGEQMRKVFEDILRDTSMGYMIHEGQFVCMVCAQEADTPDYVEHKVDCMQLRISRAIAAWDDARR